MTLPPSSHTRIRRLGFSLVEIMVVVGILALLMAAIIPMMARSRTGDVRRSAQQIEGALQIARAHAMAHQTYVWVGFFEENVKNPGAATAEAGIGRIVISIVASEDGTPLYNRDLASSASPSTQDLPGANLTQIGNLITLNNVHIFKPTEISGGAGKFEARPGAAISDDQRVGLSEAAPLLFRFQYPLTGSAQYTFGKRPAVQKNGHPAPSGIIQFNPRGEAVSDAGPLLGGVPCMEIAIQATHGNTPSPSPNIAAVNIGGITGQTTIYQR